MLGVSNARHLNFGRGKAPDTSKNIGEEVAVLKKHAKELGLSEQEIKKLIRKVKKLSYGKI